MDFQVTVFFSFLGKNKCTQRKMIFWLNIFKYFSIQYLYSINILRKVSCRGIPIRATTGSQQLPHTNVTCKYIFIL